MMDKRCVFALMLLAAMSSVSTFAFDVRSAALRGFETWCQGMDQHHENIKAKVYTKKEGQYTATCHIRSGLRTKFEVIGSSRQLEVAGYFLGGTKLGRWEDGGKVQLYRLGDVMQESPKTSCDYLANFTAVVIVYCPRNVDHEALLSDLRAWKSHFRDGAIFDIYSSEKQAPMSDAAYDAFPKSLESINFAAVQFSGDDVSSFQCWKQGQMRECGGKGR